jgi:hypothetical protein
MSVGATRRQRVGPKKRQESPFIAMGFLHLLRTEVAVRHDSAWWDLERLLCGQPPRPAYGQANSQLLANSPRAAFWLIYIKESPFKPAAIHLSDLGEGSCVDLITRTLTLQRTMSHERLRSAI